MQMHNYLSNAAMCVLASLLTVAGVAQSRPDKGVGHDGGGASRQEIRNSRVVLTSQDKKLIQTLADMDHVSASRIEKEARKQGGIAAGLAATIKAESKGKTTISVDEANKHVEAAKVMLK
jgi:hypothetical protein